MALSCTVCTHPQRDAIEKLASLGMDSERSIAKQFGLSDSAIHRHKSHITARLTKMIEKRGEKADDVFMARHEHLYAETLQYVEDAKKAVKMQRVTVEEIAEDGSVKHHEAYQAMRDVGAMAPALQTAVQLQRVLGDATARFSQAVSAGTVNIALQLVIPRDLSPTTASELPAAIEVQALPADTQDAKELAPIRATLSGPTEDS